MHVLFVHFKSAPPHAHTKVAGSETLVCGPSVLYPLTPAHQGYRYTMCFLASVSYLPSLGVLLRPCHSHTRTPGECSHLFLSWHVSDSSVKVWQCIAVATVATLNDIISTWTFVSHTLKHIGKNFTHNSKLYSLVNLRSFAYVFSDYGYICLRFAVWLSY